MDLHRPVNAFAVLLSVLLGLACPALAYEGGALKNHNHSSSAGDGGLLSNVTLGGNTTASVTSGTYTATVSTNATLGLGSISAFLGYRRPNLNFISATTIQPDCNVAFSTYAVTVLFPDNEIRTSTNLTDIVFDITRTAVFNGSNQSGLRSGLSRVNNTKWALYAVKTTNDSNFVIVGDSITPTIGTTNNAQPLNTAYGTNAYVYLGQAWDGDSLGSPSGILNFTQNGSLVCFRNTQAGASELAMVGMYIGGTTAGTSFTYTYASGMGPAQIPPNIVHVYYAAACGAGGSGTCNITNGAGTQNWSEVTGTTRSTAYTWAHAAGGVKIASTASTNMNAAVACYIDGTLANGDGGIYAQN